MSRSTVRLKIVLQSDLEEPAPETPETRPTTRQRRVAQSDLEGQELGSRPTLHQRRALYFDLEGQELESRPTPRQRRAPHSDPEEQHPEDLQPPHLAESSRQRATSGGKHSARKVRIQYKLPQVRLNPRGLTHGMPYFICKNAFLDSGRILLDFAGFCGFYGFYGFCGFQTRNLN